MISPLTTWRLLNGRPFQILLVCLIVVGGSWSFIRLADVVEEGHVQHFDERVVHALQRPADALAVVSEPGTVPIGPHWLLEIGRDITALGGVAVLTLVVIAVVGYLLILHRYRAMWLILLATLGGIAISSGLKRMIDRPRPDVSHYSYVSTSSFPSGHSMLSAVVYITLGALLTRQTPYRLAKLYILTGALLVTFLVGVSRVYMGVHYPTDVLAGWMAGIVWALVCLLVANLMEPRPIQPDIIDLE